MERNITMMQQTLTKAKNHVHAYQIQWQESKRIIKLACLDVSNQLPSLFRRKVLTIDMGEKSLPS